MFSTTLRFFSELLDNLRPVSPKPGHVERVRTPSCPQGSSTETDDQESAVFRERFLKINVRHITDGQGVVGGVLLVTPNAVMFDPNVSDPLVIEHGPEAYGVIAPMEFVVNAAIYNDIAHMRVGHVESSSGEKPEIYYPRSDKEPDSLMVKDETFPELGKLWLCSPGYFCQKAVDKNLYTTFFGEKSWRYFSIWCRGSWPYRCFLCSYRRWRWVCLFVYRKRRRRLPESFWKGTRNPDKPWRHRDPTEIVGGKEKVSVGPSLGDTV